MNLEHRIQFQPGYNNRPKGGVHGMSIRFLAIGPDGATQFTMNTGWVPGEPMSPRTVDLFPMATDLGFHARRPLDWMQEDNGYAEMFRATNCDLTPDGVCWYDGSGLNAEPVMARFIVEGESAVWEELHRYYESLFAVVSS